MDARREAFSFRATLLAGHSTDAPGVIERVI